MLFRSHTLSGCPYLGPGFEFQSKDEHHKHLISRVFCFNYGAFPSQGLSGCSIAGLKYSVPKIVNHITRNLFLDHHKKFLDDLHHYDLKDF